MSLPAGFFVFLAAATYVSHSVSVKFSSGKIDPYTGILFWSLGTFIIGVCTFAYAKFTAQATEITLTGASLLTLAGAFIAAGSVSFLMAYERGAQFSFAAPAVNISVVTGGLIFGLLLFKEDISLARLAGIALGAASIFLLTRN